MNKRSWSSNDELNLFKTKCNEFYYDLDIVLTKLSKITNNSLNLDNLIDDYRNKILNLADQAKNFGFDFFERNSVRTFIDKLLLIKIQSAIDLISVTIDEVIKVSKSYIPWKKTIIKKMLTKFESDYYEIRDFIRFLSFENVLNNSIMDKYSSDQYHIFTPGTYRQMFDEDKYFFSKIGLEKQFLAKEKELLELIDIQEKNSMDHDEKLKKSIK